VSKPLVQELDTQLGFLGQFSAVSQVELRVQVGAAVRTFRALGGGWDVRGNASIASVK